MTPTTMRHTLLALAAAATAATLLALAWPNPPAQAQASAAAPALATVEVGTGRSTGWVSYDGVVQAERLSVLAAQVPGAVVQLAVRPGDRVQTGQVLLRLDARAAEQQAGAAAAQLQAGRAAQEAATREFDRQKQLFTQRYISQAALDRAESQHKAALAEAQALLASAGAAQTQSGFYVIKAPYDAVVAEVSAVLGDMALPGKPLLTLYDPTQLRISAALPQSVAARLAVGAGVASALAELPGAAESRITPTRRQLLPAVDPATHTLELRLDLPRGVAAAPGQFARAWIAASEAGSSPAAAALSVPASAVVRRAELTAVYVLAPGGRPLLRQVRLGPQTGDRIEVLAGLSAGERVVLDPQAAARQR